MTTNDRKEDAIRLLVTLAVLLAVAIGAVATAVARIAVDRPVIVAGVP